MSLVKHCASCRTVLSEFAPLFSCCDSKRLLCRRCKPSHCPICLKAEWREVKETQCLICKRKLRSEEALREEICGEHYCPRCVAHAFLPHFLSGDPPFILEMRCGHFKDRLEVEAFLSDYCINCGFKFRPSIDLELQGGMKFCDYCFRYDDRKQFEEFFQRCLSCGQVLSFKESSHCREFPMCHQCSANQTLIEQSLARSPHETKPASLISEIKSEKMKPFGGQIDEEEPSEELSIVSRFSAFEIEDSEGRKGAGKLASMKALSKNSVEIRVQNYKLPAVTREPRGKLVQCYLCCILLEEEGTLLNTTLSSSRICKMCYAQTFDKSFLSYTRYNNYLQGDQRTASLQKQPPAPSHMKLSMLPSQQPSASSKEAQALSALLKHPVPPRTEKKEAWETEAQIRNPCEICRVRPAMIIRADKKKLCVQCKNKHG